MQSNVISTRFSLYAIGFVYFNENSFERETFRRFIALDRISIQFLEKDAFYL